MTFNLRMRAIARYGQSSTGAVEDAIAVGGAALITQWAAGGTKPKERRR